jgi:hypothetical protein
MQDSIDNEVLAYIGGILDGEGCILISKSNRTRKENKNPVYSTRISVSMCDKEIPELFYKLFGGSLQKRHRSKNRKHKPTYEWILSTKKCIHFLEIIIPFLRIERKIKTARICLEFQKHVTNKNIKGKRLTKEELDFREEMYLFSKEFNHRGL